MSYGSGDGLDGPSLESKPIHHPIICHPFNWVFTWFFGSGESGVYWVRVKLPGLSEVEDDGRSPPVSGVGLR